MIHKVPPVQDESVIRFLFPVEIQAKTETTCLISWEADMMRNVHSVPNVNRLVEIQVKKLKVSEEVC